MAPPSWLEWAESATRKKHVTIRDIERLPMRSKHTIMCLDRNFGDFVYNLASKKRKKGQSKVTVDVRDLLKTCYVFEYEHVADLCGLATWQGKWAEDRCPELFEFDVEYAPDSYYGLRAGHLPKGRGRDMPKGAEGKSWMAFPRTRRVGWRGPCLFVKDLRALPKKMYYEFS